MANNAGIDNPGLSDKTAEIKAYTTALPLTAGQLAQSNQKIIDAYYDIASFYLQELNDPEEAEEVYQILLNRFPGNNHLAASYYGLFLIYKNKDQTAATNYKNKILKEFPGTVYAKTILDPSFSLKQTELETTLNKEYNSIFEQYQKKDFTGVMQMADQVLKNKEENYLSPQYAYLKAIAIGRTNHVDTLLTTFNGITNSFPDDKLITPLVKDHIAYINEHLQDFQKRKIAFGQPDPDADICSPLPYCSG